MPTFRQLPFQYQQRGPELSRAAETDTAKFGRFTEQRDQDLENYLAGLGGAKSSGAGFQMTQVTGGGTALTAGTQTLDGAFGGALGEQFDAATGEYLGNATDFILLQSTVVLIPSGVGMATVYGDGNSMSCSTSCTVIGSGASPAANTLYRMGGVGLIDAASYNAVLAGPNPGGGLLGIIIYTPLFPGATYVDATLAEPATLTVNIDFSLRPPIVNAIAW